MKRGAYLVNTARGKICDRDAVVRALESGQLAGYAGDVWFPQPAPRDHPWRTMPHHGMTPHISGSSLSAQARYAAGTREILECLFERRPIREEYLIVERGGWPGPAPTPTRPATRREAPRRAPAPEASGSSGERLLRPAAPRGGSRPMGYKSATCCAYRVRVEALLGHELLVGARLDDASLIEDDDEVGVTDGAQPVRDQKAVRPSRTRFRLSLTVRSASASSALVGSSSNSTAGSQ